MSSPLIIGLTGGIASGKSTVANLFKKQGITIIDADHITRELTVPGSPILLKIIEKFGYDILNPDKTLDRFALRKIVFQNENARLWLENLLHPEVKKIMEKQAKQATSPYCILVIPLLIETQFPPKIDRMLVVDASKNMQIQRLKQQNRLTDLEIKTILTIQASRTERFKKADDIIKNEQDLKQLEKQVDLLHQKYSQMV